MQTDKQEIRFQPSKGFSPALVIVLALLVGYGLADVISNLIQQVH